MSVVFEGNLKKKSPANRHIWQTRYFVLKGGERPELRYYKSKEEAAKGDGPEKTRVALKGLRVCEIPVKGKGSEKKCRLNLHLEDRVFDLMSETGELAKEWQSHIMSLCPAAETLLFSERMTCDEVQGWLKEQSYCGDDCYASLEGFTGSDLNQASIGDLRNVVGEVVASQLFSKLHEKGWKAPDAGTVAKQKMGEWLLRKEKTRAGDVTVEAGEEDEQQQVVGDSVCEGWMMKKHKRNRHRWQNRYFVLKNDPPALLYYKTRLNAAQGEEAGRVALDEIKSVEIPESGKGAEAGERLNVHLPTRVFELMCQNQENCNVWSDSIVEVTGVHKKTPTNVAREPMCDFAACTMQGNLKKESPKGVMGIHMWQTRYFALEVDSETSGEESRLMYWRNEKESKAKSPTGSVPVKSIITVKPFMDSAGCYYFMIHINGVRGRVFVLQGKTQQESQKWLKKIGEALKMAREKMDGMGIEGPPQPKPVAAPAAKPAAIAAPTAAESAAEEEVVVFCMECGAKNDGTFCADCGAKL